MTYTIIAAWPDAGLLGVAVASRSLSVGSSVPALAPKVGAVASQAHTDRDLRSLALDGLRAGRTPAEVIDDLRGAGDLRYRQVGVINADGNSAVHTGTGCSAWAGARSGDHHAIFGNLLTGPEVLEAMDTGFRRDRRPAHDTDSSWAADASTPWRLLTALRAGRDAGGDRRGQQSAAILLIDNHATDHHPPSTLIDLRVDDHPDPITELERLLRLRLQLARDWLGQAPADAER